MAVYFITGTDNATFQALYSSSFFFNCLKLPLVFCVSLVRTGSLLGLVVLPQHSRSEKAAEGEELRRHVLRSVPRSAGQHVVRQTVAVNRFKRRRRHFGKDEKQKVFVLVFGRSSRCASAG